MCVWLYESKRQCMWECELFCKYFAFFCIINCPSPLFGDRTIIVSAVCALFVFEVEVVYMKYHIIDLCIPQYMRMLMYLSYVLCCYHMHNIIIQYFSFLIFGYDCNWCVCKFVVVRFYLCNLIAVRDRVRLPICSFLLVFLFILCRASSFDYFFYLALESIVRDF